jgi:hypothetical protein
MAASCRPRMTWRFASPYTLVASPEPCVWAHALVGARLVVQGGDLSGMQPFGQGLVVLPMRVLTKIRMPSLRQRQVVSALLLDVVISKGTAILKLLAS